jgi:endonuclease YncB( thermonuclease family)
VETGLSANAQVVSVHDGDTITVEVRFRVPIRIRDLYAPELKEQTGPAAKEALESLLPVGSSCVVFIPSKNPLLLMDSVSLGRIVGDVYNQQDINVAKDMIERGFGTIKKVKI